MTLLPCHGGPCARVRALPGPPRRRQVPLRPCRRTDRPRRRANRRRGRPAREHARRSPPPTACSVSWRAPASRRGVRTITEPDGGVQRTHLHGVHPGLSRDLRGTHRMCLGGRRLADGCPLPGPGQLEFRQEHGYLRSVGFFRPAQRGSGRLTRLPVRLRPARTRPPPASTSPTENHATLPRSSHEMQIQAARQRTAGKLHESEHRVHDGVCFRSHPRPSRA